MKLTVDNDAATPVFQQLVDQIHFAISAGELAGDEKLPSIRSVASDLSVAPNTVAKAYRQLEFRGLIKAQDRSGFVVVTDSADNRYTARGVSADKTEVHDAVDQLEQGLFPGAFCKITEDYLSGDPTKCNVIHADGAGTKSIVAYLWYKETGDAGIFRGIAQDSIVMNLDDLLCVGVDGRILISNTINRNALNCPGEVIAELINGTESFLQSMRDQGVNLYSGGGETADVGDLTGTLVVDSCAVAIMDKRSVITNDISGELAIVGLSSTGQAIYEGQANSGMGSNGLTSARHDMLSNHYAEQYPEAFDANVDPELIYCGPYRLSDPLPNSHFTVGEAILSPTRTYAPVIYRMRDAFREALKGVVHCSGGAQTKCLRFGRNTHFIKDNLFDIPPLFSAIQSASGTSWDEMYKVFNMGHRMEVYVPASLADEAIDIASSFGIGAQVIGRTEPADRNHLTLTDRQGKAHRYWPS
ncbi:MAG: GntR family transcriptional regulator [Pseudomonadales bacterium]|nr:GntR family transcriptional regulator [Pseudomonadales bacterium]MBO6565281.1 GntR family transcriptional regulator [Pseudomonadales bacterium]MBO6596453.1 GntR family transcriptional regulator [Pseudomonadales bacterium]MBO6822933.1 GntR family transcriptional regulator [Pseudomonadales bacterium]